jgi:hypothetical protein
MIYPSDLSNRYYRVGWFLARAYYGGMSMFDHKKEEIIELR